MEEFVESINSIYPLSSKLKECLSLMLKEKSYQKKDFLLKEKQVCRNIWYIKKGYVRCFYRRNSTEVSSWFMREGDLIISVDSYFTQKASRESIQALEDCVTYSIEYDQLQYLYKTFPEFNYVGRVLTEKYYALSEERLHFMRMQRSDEKYLSLLQNHQDLIQRVPAKYLASYIGVTEETLSRIRGKRY